ncbi:MAG TPA: glutamyl-tRNA reductase [Streptosporangiaceae bacterium]|jgi:glutamyl-tRNA reductase|nr:glutamyl-tRNA reductase [Streptosporangiaceae bacterium]
MSTLVVGLSHKSAPVATLERTVVSGDDLHKLRSDVFHAEHVAGTFIVSTCNRTEIYADVDKFHGGVSSISELLARHSGIPLADLTPHLYVHYEDRAVQHLLAVACGLDSMVVGESQILGQVRQALGLAREQGTLDRELGELGRLALRTGKRAHAETGIDQAGANVVSVGLELAAARLGTRAAALHGCRVLVVGAGSMSTLAAVTASRLDPARLVIANRTLKAAERLASRTGGAATSLAELPDQIAAADLVISCTGATGFVITERVLTAVLARRDPAGRPLVLLDLALPRDVEPGAAARPGVSLIDLEMIGATAGGGAPGEDVAAVRAIVADELAARASAVRAASVTPTVVALRAKAALVVETELARLGGRLNGLDDHALDEIGQTVRRVVDKLLHAPTVRIKELAAAPGGDDYAAALQVLFDLDPKAVEAVTRAAADLGPDQEAPE